MNKKVRAFELWLAALFVLSGAGICAGQGPGACVTCHIFLGGELSRPVTEWNGSVHQRNEITCDLCHGGDAGVDVGDVKKLSDQEFKERQSRAMSKSYGFIGKPSGSEMFAMCSQCHADSVARYAGSIMGKAYLDDQGGPSCVTCHSAHDNVIPSVPESCAGCHQDTTGFDMIDPMNVTAATVNQLSRIRIGLAAEKAEGARPLLAPAMPQELDTYQTGLVAFSAVFVLFLIGWLLYIILEKRK